MNFTEFSKYYIAKIDEINTFFINTLDLAEPLKNSLMYSYTAGGKRIRPLLMLSMLEAFQEDINKGLKTAACLELIHTSSLIHDDLPAMDNDDYRRGKLTNHKVFGEATAILAGDSLLVDSIRLITDDDLLDNEIKVQLISYLSNCVGAKGMIGGQQLDIEHDNFNLETLKKINYYKTGKLLEFSLVAPAIISKKNSETRETLKEIGYHIGMAFQIKDDLLDVVGDKDIMGKATKRDEKNNKITYICLLGIEKANEELNKHYHKALSLLRKLDVESNLIEELFALIINRNK